MAVYVPITWENDPSTDTPMSATNLNTMEDRLQLIDLLYQALGGTAAIYEAGIGAPSSFLRSNGTSPGWRTAALVRADLDLEVGTDVQAFDALLQAIAALTTAADQVIYSTGSNAVALAAFTAVARTLLAATTQTAQRTVLGVGTGDSPTFTGVTTTGNVAVGGQGYSPMVTLTDGATITPNGDAGNSFMVTVAGNRTMAAITNQQAGAVYNFLIKKSGSGRTITWNSAYKFPGGIDAQLSTGANPDLFSFLSDGTLLYPAGKNLA